MNREKLLVKNTLIIALGTITPQLAGIITLPIITGGLTKAENGTYELINTLVSLLIPILTLQLELAAFRFLIDKRGNEKESGTIISTVMTFALLAPIVPLVIMYFALVGISAITKLLICLFFYFDVIVITLGQIVRGIDNNKNYSISAIIRSVTRVLLIVFTIKNWSMGLNGLLLAMGISSAVACGVLFLNGNIFRYYNPRLFSKSTFKDMVLYSLPMIPNSICLWVMNLSNRFLITAFLGVEMVAVFSVANKIPNLFSVVQTTFTYAWQENASMTSEANDASDYYGRVFDTIFNILVGVMALLIAATPVIYSLLIRGEYEESYNQMPILFMGIFMSTLNSFFGGIYVALKKTSIVGLTTVVGAVINVLINLVFINWIGLYASSIATFVSFLVLVMFRMINIQKFLPIEYNWKKFFFWISVLVIMCVTCFMQNIVLNIINMLIACVCVYVLNKTMILGILGKLKYKLKG